MKVETYDILSVDTDAEGNAINEAVSEEALVLIADLGLEGQQSMIASTEVEGESVERRVPYRMMTAEEQAIFSAMMPRHIAPKAYNDGPIPLRALQVLAHAQTLDFFNDIQIWCPEPGRDDPLLVGYKKNGYQNRLYILARWGDELDSLEVLREKAKAKIVAEARRNVVRLKQKIALFEAVLEESANAYLSGNRPETEYLGTLGFGG